MTLWNGPVDSQGRPYLGDPASSLEPTALAYSPNFACHEECDGCYPQDPKETVQLAVASARRWAARTDLSAETRLRRMYLVLATALEA